MPKERRKEPRFAFNRVTTLRTERNGSPRECLITNLSRDGARLFSEAPAIPDQFDLTINEALARRCQVVWRLGGEIGVKFLDGSVPIGSPAFEH
jgi:PilZ domain